MVLRFLCLSLLVTSALAEGTISIQNLAELRSKLGADKYDSQPGFAHSLRQVKVAVLDKGFGDPSTIAQELPPEVFTLVSSYDAEFVTRLGLGRPEEQSPLDPADDHGRSMALALWGVTGFSKQSAPRILLLNANGFTNFTRAVHYCKEQGVDVILFSQNWEYGGNFDGGGFINKVVDVATSAGILWVNAAGNYGGKVYDGPVKGADTGWLELGRSGLGLTLESRLDRNPVKIFLSWNRYGDTESQGTDADLDLVVADASGNEVGRGDLKQILGGEGVERKEGESFVPREIFEGRLDRGTYSVRVQAKGGTFGAADRLRVTVLGLRGAYFDGEVGGIVEPVRLVEARRESEVMIPADNSSVIAVGDRSSQTAWGPTADGRAKPDVLIDSSVVEFSDGEGTSGTSNAAALFAGVVALMKAQIPSLDRSEVLEFVRMEQQSGAAATSEAAGVMDRGVNAFSKAQPGVHRALTELLGKSSVLLAGMNRQGTWVVALDKSPLELGRYFTHLPRRGSDPSKWEVYLTQVRTPQGPEVQAFWRNPSQLGAQAWEKTLEQSPNRFVKVVQSRWVDFRQLRWLPLWETPTPEALRDAKSQRRPLPNPGRSGSV